MGDGVAEDMLGAIADMSDEGELDVEDDADGCWTGGRTSMPFAV